LALLSTAAILLATALFSGTASAATVTYGQDVSGHQGNVNWTAQWNAGSRFAYVKATEGSSYTNPYFAQPNGAGGAAQADYFIAHGGGWSKDGKTLPGALDIEYNPYGATCYGLSKSGMVNWIAAFLNQYHARTGRWATIYTTTDWWTTCTGNYSGFWANSPLWLARYSSAPGTLPAGAPTWSFWQYSSTGPFAGDSNQWHGALDRLKVLACNGPC
jgi:GH25 family lysozyme M1 (1,4-beta-N-acetylmuramidase)